MSEHTDVMRDATRRALCGAFYHTGLLRTALALSEPRTARPANRPFQILVYHRVAPDTDEFLPGVPVSLFAEQMEFLARHYRLLPLSTLLEAARNHAVPPRAVAVTFDDGYADTQHHAWPILRRHGIPALVYLATSLMDDGRPMWNDRVGLVIRDTTCTRLDGFAGHASLGLATLADRRRTLRTLLVDLKRRPPGERETLTELLATRLAVKSDAAPRMLRWAGVRELHAEGLEFGAHTVNHPILTAVSTDEARAEIHASKRIVEERLQAPARHFAYPNGLAADFDATTCALVRDAGFESAATMLFGMNSADTDPYALRRGGAWGESAATFTTQLWWYRWSETHGAAAR
jgi:peptidoglycan/xylan/chitin deacetylase (PgdA/CDA1 family)